MFLNYHNPNDFWSTKSPQKNDDGMTDDDRMAVGILQGVVFFIILFGFLLLCALFSGCTTERLVTVEKVRTDTTYITKLQHDSIYMRDSIMVTEKGDTVRIEKWHTKYVESIRHDTVYKARVDSVPVPYPVEKLVEKKLSWFQKTLMGVGILTLMALVVFIGWKLKRFIP